MRNITLFVCLAAIGCAERQEASKTPLRVEEPGHVLTILLDLSGSFETMMMDEGKAHEFAMQVIDRYFNDRIGEGDKIIIAVISGNDRALVYEGTPEQLRQDFASAAEFREFLKQKSNPGGSYVHHAIKASADYMMSDPGVVSGKSKPTLFVLSDMLDNAPDSDTSRVLATESMRRLGKVHGTVGLFYVDQSLVLPWREAFQKTTIPHWCVQSEIVGRPTLPSFEE